MLTEFHIGIDDTDSPRGGCTTYTAAIIFQELVRRGVTPSDFPWLVRLNPNIPWKTRGNGALAIHLFINDNQVGLIRNIAIDIVESTSETSAPRTDPAVVFLKGQVPQVLAEYSSRALHDVLSAKEAERVSRTIGANFHLFRGARGLIGSLAAIGAGLDHRDHTFEIIAYRVNENLGQVRRVDPDSVREMNSEYASCTFQNIDPETGRVLVCPHGPDPVLLGIRGRSPGTILEAFRRLRIEEPVERIMIFRTNQGTDAHLTRTRNADELKRDQSAVMTGRVDSIPVIMRGGHVLFRLREATGLVDCLAFEPTGSFRTIVSELLPGDLVRVFGGIRKKSGRFSMNLEKLKIIQLVEATREENPKCSDCGARCESMGRNQGFRCRKCGFKLRNAPKSRSLVERKLSISLYLPPPRARRHLTRPEGFQPSSFFNSNQHDSILEVLVGSVELASKS